MGGLDTSEPILSVKSLSMSYGSQALFSGVTFDVLHCSRISILGVSGCGKSTLLKILAGILKPTNGSVNCTTDKISMLFQKNALFDSLTVSENLDLVLRERTQLPQDEFEKRIKTVLTQVGLEGVESRFPSELSGGMQKRLGLARAIIVDPELLFCDEPTAGLDPVTSFTITELLIQLCESRHLTLVATTSDRHRAFQMSEKIYFLDESRLVALGTPEEVEKSTNARVREYLAKSLVPRN